TPGSQDTRRPALRRMPVEHVAALQRADDHFGAGARPGLLQRLVDAEPLQAVGEVADGLVVAEVGLPDPPLRLLPGHLEHVVADLPHGEAGIAERLGADDLPRRLLGRPARPRLL